MKKIFYLHWNKEELEERLNAFKNLPMHISSHWNKDEVLKFTDSLPNVFIVSLDRLPSHGRQYVEWLWEAKKRQHIPVIFVDGKPDKIEQTKTKFPTAHYTTTEKLVDLLKKLI